MMRRLLIAISLLAASPAHATQVQEVVSPGGIKAWLVEEHSLPLVAVRVAFTGSGYAYDPKGKEGRANMATALLLEGAGELDSAAFNEAIESRAIQMNMSADEDKVEALMQSLSEHKESAFSYLGMALSSPRFDDAAMERVRRQTESAITQQEERPGFQAYRQWLKLAFGEHNYANPALGAKDTLPAITKPDLQLFTRSYLTRQNMLVAVSGDITPAELATLLDKSFATLPATYAPDTQVADVAVNKKGYLSIIDYNIPQSMVMFGTGGLKRSDPDYFVGYVMNHILGGGGALNSRLGTEIREKRGLSYGITTNMDPMAKSAAWRGGFSTRNEKASEAQSALISTISAFVKDGPTAAELSDAKQYLTGSFTLNLDSNDNLTAFLIAMQENNLGRDYLNRRNSLVEKVTMNEVVTLARRLIDPDNLLMVFVGKPNLIADKPEK